MNIPAQVLNPILTSTALDGFHPVVADWFRSRLGEPTPVQAEAWPAIRQSRHTLIAAPTGSGKTLAAFLTILNDLILQGLGGNLADRTHIVYVSPLKALSNDIEKNLKKPLQEIQDAMFQDQLREIRIRVAVRTGDTPTSERASMLKTPPHILITTPESLYLLLTSQRGRKLMGSVKTVIVDEIHAMVGDKRGSHLALSLERLQALAEEPLVRIGLSATQSPIETVARFLVGGNVVEGNVEGGNEGAGDAIPSSSPPCTIIDTGHRRRLDIAVEVPDSPLSAVMAAEVWEEVYSRIEAHIQAHRTTLIFVNTRRLAERVAHRLSESLGEDKVTAHHGSLSKDRRLSAEQRLKSGSLSALVATASLELGIDIGSVDLVIQIGCPKTISAFLQRVGRAGHSVQGIPKGRLFPLTIDELVEAASLLDSVRRGELDRLAVPEKPLDILAQQVVAEVASREWKEEELFALVRRAYPYRSLERTEFDEVVGMLSQGFSTRRGRRGAYLHHDAVNGRLRGRPGARLTALTNGGAIPDTFDYEVRLEPENTMLGTVNEDFALESLPGDIMQLGNASWRILRVEGSSVRVADAQGQPPTLPFWLGEAPGRSTEFSISVSRLREDISRLLGEIPGLEEQVGEQPFTPEAPWKGPAMQYLTEDVGLDAGSADQLIDYLAAAKLSLGVMPTQNTLVLERFFDEAGDMHLVVHSPFGSRLNRAWGLALRKRFCRKFNFELQAAATEDSIILSLGATHSFPLEDVFQYLNSRTVRPLLVQALLDAPMFGVRWRWNATRSLAVLRNRGGKKTPPQLQRMASEDLVSLVFPDSLACLENIPGEREIPDHPLVRQTIEDCLTEAMDITRLESLLASIEQGGIRLETRDLKEPSPLSLAILSARPYAFLDDAPLEERRTRAVQSRRWLDPREASDLGRLDPRAIAEIRSEAWPQARTPDELHDALLLTGFLTDEEIDRGEGGVSWTALLQSLVDENRVASMRIPKDGLLDVPATGNLVWVAAERLGQFRSALPDAVIEVLPILPIKLADKKPRETEDALTEILRGRLEALGPVTAKELMAPLGRWRPVTVADAALLALEQEGFVIRGRFSEGIEEIEWCERRLLARIHRLTLNRLRREIEPVSTADYMRFLFRRHGLDSKEKPTGPESLEAVLVWLEGYEAPAAAWEKDIFPARLARYESSWLDLHCLSGHVVWGRIRPRPGKGSDGNAKKPATFAGPIKSTPIAFLGRDHLSIWQAANGGTPPKSGNGNGNGKGLDVEEPELSSYAEQVLVHIEQRGASFLDEIVRGTGLLKTQVEEGIAELVSGGLLTSDSFRGLRALLHPPGKRSDAEGRRGHSSLSSHSLHSMDRAGRWSLLRPRRRIDTRSQAKSGVQQPEAGAQSPHSQGLEAIAWTLLRRYGVLFRRLADRETLTPPWRDLVRTLRTLEARGEIRGGRFVEGVYGEQYALPEAVGALRKIRKENTPEKGSEKSDGKDSDKNDFASLVSLSAADPMNLQGVLTPGPKIPANRKNRVLFRDGVPVAAVEGGEIAFLYPVEETEKWELQKVLRHGPAKLVAS